MRSMFAAAMCVSLSACSLFMHSMEKPKAEVRDVSVTSAGFTGVSGQLRMDVMNPNAFGVPLSGIDWTLAIGGARAVTGRVELRETIPAKGVAPVTTSLTINAVDAIAVAQALSSGAREYQLSARLHFSTQIGQLDVQVDHTGTLGGGGGSPIGMRF